MNIREAFDKASAENLPGHEKYERIFELMYGRLPSDEEREMIRRRCLWYEHDESVRVDPSARRDGL